MFFCLAGFFMNESIKVIKMQKINRSELAKSAIAGGNCKTTCLPATNTTTTIIQQPAPAPAPTPAPPKVMYKL
jgi:hypothetical protein